MNKFFQKIQNIFSKVSLQDQIIFAKHLAIMLQAGMPIIDSLTMLKKQQAKSKPFSRILNQLIADVDSGQSLSMSLNRFHQVFGNLFINVIKVGETSGTLPENLNYIVEEMQKGQAINRKIKGAMVYPIIILIAVFVIVGILIFVVFPKILPLFSSLKIKLPLATRLLLFGYNLVSNNWLLIILGSVVIFVGSWLLLKNKKIKLLADYFILQIPFVGSMATNINMANLTRTLSLLLKSGVKIVDSLETTANSLSNSVYQQELKKVAVEISSGGQIFQYLLKRPKLFPIMLSQMIEVGENTGNLSQTLLYLNNFYETEVDEITKNLSTTLEPILLIIMGVIVGFVAIAIITPIYSITQSVSK
ncbi:MAG: type II secretion system F family protein [Patescibacteria group bacterium]